MNKYVGEYSVLRTESETLDVVRRFINHWRDKDESYWFARLAEEFGELGGSLVGNHVGPVDHELRQIAAICLNWLDMRNSSSDPSAES